MRIAFERRIVSHSNVATREGCSGKIDGGLTPGDGRVSSITNGDDKGVSSS